MARNGYQKTLEFQLSPALYNAVSGEAADQRRSMAFIVRAALEAYLVGRDDGGWRREEKP